MRRPKHTVIFSWWHETLTAEEFLGYIPGALRARFSFCAVASSARRRTHAITVETTEVGVLTEFVHNQILPTLTSNGATEVTALTDGDTLPIAYANLWREFQDLRREADHAKTLIGKGEDAATVVGILERALGPTES